MSEFAAIVIGLGIGFLIGMPAIVVYRHDIADNIRGLFRPAVNDQEVHGKQVAMRTGSKGDGVGKEDIDGLSPAIAVFAIGAAGLTTLYGILSGGTFFTVSGIFVILCVALAFLASKATRD